MQRWPLDELTFQKSGDDTVDVELTRAPEHFGLHKVCFLFTLKHTLIGSAENGPNSHCPNQSSVLGNRVMSHYGGQAFCCPKVKASAPGMVGIATDFVTLEDGKRNLFYCFSKTSFFRLLLCCCFCCQRPRRCCTARLFQKQFCRQGPRSPPLSPSPFIKSSSCEGRSLSGGKKEE